METSDEISSASDPSFSLSPLDNLSHTVSIISGPVNIANRFVTNMAKDRNGGMSEGILGSGCMLRPTSMSNVDGRRERSSVAFFRDHRASIDSSFE